MTVEGLTGEDLLVVLARVPEPRARRGRRHSLVSVLAAAVCAVLVGACSYVAIAEWVHDLPISIRILRRKTADQRWVRQARRARAAQGAVVRSQMCPTETPITAGHRRWPTSGTPQGLSCFAVFRAPR